MLAFHQDPGKVAFWLGNSPKILMNHDWQVVTPEAAKEFFAIFPP